MSLKPIPRREKIAAIFVAAAVGAVALGIFAIDYLHGRAAIQLLSDLAQLPVGTPLVEFEKRFGKPVHHLSNPIDVANWGPLQDPELVAGSELYLFVYHSHLTFRYLCVYTDIDNGRVVQVSWKSM